MNNEPTPKTNALLDERGNIKMLPNDKDACGWSSVDMAAFIALAHTLERENIALKSALKQAAKALDNGLQNLRHVVSALHATNSISPDARIAINNMKEALANPLIQSALTEE